MTRSMKPMPIRRLKVRARVMAAAVMGCYVAMPAEAQNTLLSAAQMQSQNVAIQSVKAGDLQQHIGSFKATDVANGVIVDNFASRTMATAASFHVLAGQTFTINQGVNDAFWVRVTGIGAGNAKIFQQSIIEGRITSKGQFGLINPAGTIIKPGAVIDVGRFVAALGITDTDFLAGRLNFHSNDGAGKIVNQGTITTPSGGSVYLVGTDVSNESVSDYKNAKGINDSGIIQTPQGETILAAGEKVELIDTGTPGVKVQITGRPGNVTNLGRILADAGRIGMVGAMVRNSGMLNVASGIADLDGNIDPLKVVTEGGRVFLKASQDTYVDGKGRIVATGTKGGKVQVLGDRVAVTDEAEIDASGAYGGGTILVGGDYQGKNPDVQNATITYFGPNAKLKANATHNGDGGRVIVWANDTTRAYGNIFARGGAFGGNGGFVEVSGKKFLDYQGFADRSAPKGKAGSLLLDPTGYCVYGSSGAAACSGATSSIAWSTIDSNLYGGAIEITTATGDIQVVDSYTYNRSNKLSFLAYGDFYLLGPTIENQGSGDIIVVAGWQGISPTDYSYYGGQGKVHIGGQNNGAYVPGAIKTGGSIYVYGGNSVGIDYLQAANNIVVKAGRSIWDGNWQTSGATNISAGGTVTLSSDTGWNWGDCSNAATTGCVAISADISSATQVTATVSGGTYGGIRIGANRSIGVMEGGVTTTVALTDSSTSTEHNSVELRSTGDIDTSGSTFTGKQVYIDAQRDLTYSGGVGAALYELGLMAGRNLAINAATPTTSRFTALFGSSSVAINSDVQSSGFVVFGSGIVEKKEQIETPSLLGDIPISTGGTVTINGATVSGTTGVGFLTGNLTMTGATVAASEGSIYGAVTSDLRLNNNSQMSSAGSTNLALLGSDSTIYLNDSSTYPYPSKIDSGGPINIKFSNRSSGGIVINGSDTTTTASGSSGFYVGGAPAAPGTGLNLIYSGASAAVQQTTSTVINTILNSTPSPPSTTTVITAIPPTTTGGGVTTQSGTVGGSADQFGSDSPSSSGSGSSASSGDGTQKSGEGGKPADDKSSDNGKRDDKKDDKQSAESGDKKDDKGSGKKPVGKCSA